MILVINIPLTEIVEASGDEVRIVFIEDVQIWRDLFAQSAAADDIHVMGDTIDVAPGRDGILRMEFFAMQGNVTSADFNGMVFMNRESVCEVPLHVRGAGEAVEVQADDVEFLSPRGEGEGASAGYAPAASAAPAAEPASAGFTAVETDELPF